MFVNDTAELNKGGIYGIDLYHLGVPTTVIVDDRLPIFEDQNGNKRTLYA